MEEKKVTYTFKVTKTYFTWFKKLPPSHADLVTSRLLDVAAGHFGVFEPIRGGIRELKFGSHGGIRVYYSIRNDNTVVLLLAGGKKDTQDADIKKAIKLNKEFTDEAL